VRARVNFTVSIPRTLRLNATTGNGDVTIAKAGAEVTATTGNGRVTVGETSGRVNVTSGNGDIRVDNASGQVHVSTGNGRVFVNAGSGPVSVSSGNGDIDVRVKSVTSASDMNFVTGSGSIMVALPNDYNGDVDLSTGNGSMSTDFEIKVAGRMNPQHI